MNDDAVQRLEIKIAFLERANTELSDEVYRHRRELDELGARLASIVSRLETLAAPAPAAAQDERPPHY